MTAIEVGEDRLAAITADLQPPRVSEIVLRTSQFDAMRAWYQAALSAKPVYEFTPENWDRLRERQSAKFTTEIRLCFLRVGGDFPYGQTLALFDVAHLAPSDRSTGLHHMQFRHRTLADLFERYERLKAVGIEPFKSYNHGPATSFYYEDLDRNLVELSGVNFATEAAYIAYFSTPSFQRNPAGCEIDAADFVARFRAGEPLDRLVRLPE